MNYRKPRHFSSLGRDVLRLNFEIPGRGDRRYKLYLVLFVLGILATTVEVIRIYLKHSLWGIWDFPVAMYYAEIVMRGGELYSLDPASYVPSVTYSHPPLSLALLVIAIKLNFSWETLSIFVSFGHVLCFVASIFFCWFGSRFEKSWVSFFAVFFSALLMMPLMEYNLMALLLEPLLLLLFCLSLFFCSTNRQFLSGFFMGIGAALKIYPAIFGAYYLSTKRWSAIAGMALSFALCLVFSIYVFGAKENFAYFFVGLPKMLEWGPHLFFYENISLASYALYFKVFSPEQAKVFGRILFIIFFVASLFPSFMQRERGGGSVALDYACLTSLLILCMPNSWWNYQIHLSVSAWVVAVFIARQERVPWFLLAVFVSALLVLALTAILASDRPGVDYFVRMDDLTRMVYIVLRGLPNLLLFALPLTIRWGVFLNKLDVKGIAPQQLTPPPIF